MTGYWNRVLTEAEPAPCAGGLRHSAALGAALLRSLRRHALAAAAASSWMSPAPLRKPGTVWLSENDWKIADGPRAPCVAASTTSASLADQAGHNDQ